MAELRGRLPRVLFAIGSLEPGGSEGQLVTLLEQVHGTRLDAALVAISPAADPRHTERVRRLGVPFAVLSPGGRSPRSLATAMRRYARVLRRFRPDAVYPWLEEATLLAAPPARLLRIPVVVARRNVSGTYAGRPRPLVAAIHAAERLCAVATANSQAVANEAVRRGIPARRVRIVPNGHAVPPEAPLPGGREVVLGYLARMRPEKGHLRLVRALARVDGTIPWRVELGGDGETRAAVEAEVARTGLGDRVRFAGPVSDPLAFWRGCDVAVLLSDHEGSPNALIEAALLGRPLVATAVGGIPDLVGDGGLLVGLDDPAATAAALSRLIGDAGLRERLGVAARSRAASLFSIDRFVEGHLGALEEAMEARIAQ